jgi:hypothetical protein
MMLLRLALVVTAIPLLAQDSGCSQTVSDLFAATIQAFSTSLIYVLVNTLVGGLFPTA